MTCNCYVHETGKAFPSVIIFCPLHKAAESIREALEALIEIVDSIRQQGDETGYLKQAIQDAKHALAHAKEVNHV